MATNTLAVNVIAKTAVFEGKMRKANMRLKVFAATGRSAQKAFFRFGRSALLAATTAAFAVRRVTNVLLSFIKVASDAEEATNAFNVVFGRTAANANKWAKEFGSKVGRSILTVREHLISFQDTLVPLGSTRKQASALSKKLVKLAVDVGSLRNKLDEDVINNFQSALVGNVRAVRKYGIVLSQARLNQTALDAGIKGGITNLSGYNKTLLRAILLIRDSRDAQDDAERTAHTWANQVKRAEGNWQMLQKTMGGEMLPEATKMITNLNRFMEKLNKNSTELGETMSRIFNVLKAFSGFTSPLIGMVTVFRTFRGYLLDVLSTLTLIASKLSKFSTVASVISKLTGVDVQRTLKDTSSNLAGGASRQFAKSQAPFRHFIEGMQGAFSSDKQRERKLERMRQFSANRKEERARIKIQEAREAETARAEENFRKQNALLGISGGKRGGPSTREVSAGFVSTSGLAIGGDTLLQGVRDIIDQQEITNMWLKKLNIETASGSVK